MTFYPWEFVVIHCIAFAAPSYTCLFCNRVMCVQLCCLASHKMFFSSQFVEPICVYHCLHSKSAFHGRFIQAVAPRLHGKSYLLGEIAPLMNYTTPCSRARVFSKLCVFACLT